MKLPNNPFLSPPALEGLEKLKNPDTNLTPKLSYAHTKSEQEENEFASINQEVYYFPRDIRVEHPVIVKGKHIER